jgi:hypothetical protein
VGSYFRACVNGCSVVGDMLFDDSCVARGDAATITSCLDHFEALYSKGDMIHVSHDKPFFGHRLIDGMSTYLHQCLLTRMLLSPSFYTFPSRAS